MDPVGIAVLGAIVVGGLLVGALVLWWTVRAAIGMVKRAIALLFVLGTTAALLAAAAAAFLATHR